MIAIYLKWSEYHCDLALGRMLAGSLEFGSRRSAQSHYFQSGVMIKTAQRRGWCPAKTRRGELVLFDGYIDNLCEMRLILGDKTFDDEMLYAEAYNLWGDDVDLKLSGQYSVIIFKPGENIIRVSRSPILAPPLHLWNDNNQLIISSTPRTIFATGEIKKELDEYKIADALILNYNDRERSWFKGVKSLPVGARAFINPGNISICDYYKLSELKAIKLTTDDEYVEAADKLFKDATKSSLHSFSRPGISLSGGLDSQAVAAYAMQELGETPLSAFSSVPEKGWDGRTTEGVFGNESNNIQALGALYSSLKINWIECPGLDFNHKLDALIAMTFMPPIASPNMYWIHEVWNKAKSHNCDVVLTGNCGNLTFSFDGMGTLPNMLRRGEFRKLYDEFSATKGETKLVRNLISQSLKPFMPDDLKIWWYNLRTKGIWHPYNSWCPINPEYALDMCVEERAKELGFDYYFFAKKSTIANRMCIFGNGFGDMADVMQSLDSLYDLPTRDPTSYRPLVEFCLGIPDDQFMRLGQTRWLARRLLKGKVPDVVIDETRRGLQAADWHLRMTRNLEDLKREIEELSNNPEIKYRLNISSLKEALDKWPSDTPIGTPLGQRLQFAVTRGITMARFIRYVQGSNN